MRIFPDYLSLPEDVLWTSLPWTHPRQSHGHSLWQHSFDRDIPSSGGISPTPCDDNGMRPILTRLRWIGDPSELVPRSLGKFWGWRKKPERHSCCCFFCKQRFHRKSTPTNRLKPVFSCDNLCMCLTFCVKSKGISSKNLSRFSKKCCPNRPENWKKVARISPWIDFCLGFFKRPQQKPVESSRITPANFFHSLQAAAYFQGQAVEFPGCIPMEQGLIIW